MDLQQNLSSETVGHAHPAPAEPVSFETTTTVREVLHRLKELRTGAALICRDGILVGVFTERDGLKLLAQGADLDMPIEQVMTRDPITVSQDTTVADAIAQMSSGGYRRMPIVDQDGRPTGLLKVAGILHYLVQHFPNIVYTLPPQPHHATQEREGA